jgi:hypothetical protein
MDDKFILWLINEDDIVEVSDQFSREDMPEDSAFGILYDGDTLVLDLNELHYPINMEYFIKLWNALYPGTPLGIDQIIFEFDDWGLD